DFRDWEIVGKAKESIRSKGFMKRSQEVRNVASRVASRNSEPVAKAAAGHPSPIHTDRKEISSPNHKHPFPLTPTPFLLFKHLSTTLRTPQHNQNSQLLYNTPLPPRLYFPFAHTIHPFFNTTMASSSSTTNMVDEHCFRALFNQILFEEIVRRKKVTPEVRFDLEDEEYIAIREQIALRVQTEEEMEQAEQHPYKSYVRGVEVDFSPENIRRVLRFKEQTLDAETDYATRQRMDQRLDEVLTDLCIPGATWRLSSGQPAQPIQLRRADLTPLARGWQEFIIHCIIPTSNKSEITIARAILIHSIIMGEDIRAEELIADNIAVIAQGM
ncbi:hypothetical protein PIB30_093085, partial [Stylosanthes scabra]|nr:hypothetical protein [Stylosanthes scabra]